ncbi:RING-H2 finger protein ATL2-like [Prosopis cineraria]|uniref:RING-H2 finger protein ATL2-like n=1 Tax=Prosopis cineraria TaxID=364024 RepID=UPI00241014D8|nr:RING-H2 finger protein ATL2-like [Prosopis cineraria]
MAAGDHPNPNPNPFNANGNALTANILLTITLILFFLILLLISLQFYVRWYLRRARLRRRQRRRSYLVFYVDSLTPNASQPIGLDPSVIQSLPVFVYSAHSDPAECAVCLSEFQENESGRVLPKCNHTFHVECIDMWFQSHSTCPLCRSLVEPVPPGDRPGPEVVIDVREPGSSSGCHQDGEEENRSGRRLCNSLSSVGLRRKPSSVGVTVDVPLSMSRSFGREAEGSMTSLRSPGGRLLSFKRILSRERKASPPSPSSENCTAGCSSVTQIETSH